MEGIAEAEPPFPLRFRAKMHRQGERERRNSVVQCYSSCVGHLMFQPKGLTSCGTSHKRPDRGMMGDDGKDCFGLVGSLDLDVTGSVQGRMVLPWPPAL